MIVDLTVEDEHGVPVLANHGLIAPMKVDDLKAHGAQRNAIRFERALLVRASMNQRVRSGANARAVERTVSMCKSSYATHKGPLLRPGEKNSRADVLGFYLTDLLE